MKSHVLNYFWLQASFLEREKVGGQKERERLGEGDGGVSKLEKGGDSGQGKVGEGASRRGSATICFNSFLHLGKF